MPSPRGKKTLPSFYMKELQRTAAIVCSDMVHKEGAMKDLNQYDRLFKLFHGDADDKDSEGQVELLVAGKNYFSSLYDVETVNVTDCSATSNQRLKLKSQLLAGVDRDAVFVSGVDFSVETLKWATAKGTSLLTGRTLHAQAGLVHKNVRKAMGHAEDFVVFKTSDDGTRSFELPSGKNLNDLYEYVSKKMLAEMGKSDDDGKTDNLFFPGYFAFVSFTMYSESGGKHTLACFADSGHEEKGVSRKKGRKEKSAKRCSAAVSEEANVVKKGAKKQAIISSDRIKQQKKLDYESQITLFTNMNKVNVANLSNLITLARIVSPDNDLNDPSWQAVFELKNEISEIKRKMQHLTKSMEEENIYKDDDCKEEKQQSVVSSSSSGESSVLGDSSVEDATSCNGDA